ncbi:MULTISPECIES: hypothetical protein [unclassified Halorhabdus]|nr:MULTISPECIES: hypothetical protein [unclassified Halorhabdus]
MTDVDTAVETFLEQSETALDQYEQGYSDADATIRVLESHIETLREHVE